MRVSDERTRISIGGETAEPTELKAGMTCEITYAGNNQDATRLECKP